jgi:hypothetical protein
MREETGEEKPVNNARVEAMAQETWEAVWERVRAGTHVVIGPGTLPAAPSDLQVVAMHCEALGTSGSVLHAVLRNLEHLLGQELQSAAPVRGALDTAQFIAVCSKAKRGGDQHSCTVKTPPSH